MSLKKIPLHGRFEGYYGILDTETLFIYRTQENTLDFLEKPINNTSLHPVCIDPDVFDTLILHVSNMCNMRCKYCFAGHGSYRSNKGLMDPDVAVLAIQRYYSRYKYIREIKLFGGEPAMNIPAIRAVGEYVTEMHSNGKIERLPVLKMITNGTLVTDELIDLINRFKIKVVFSIDGPESVHDCARIMADGSGSFAKVKQNFERIREATNQQQPYSIDVTYSHYHEVLGLSVYDIVRFCTENFKVKPQKVNVSLVSAPSESTLHLSGSGIMLHSAEETLQFAEKGDARMHMKLKAVIRRLKNRVPATAHFCSAAENWSAVSYQGDVYPCLMFMDREEYHMGNIFENLFEQPEYQRVYQKFQGIYKADNHKCAECDYITLCSCCMGLNEYDSGDLHQCVEESCEERKKIIMLAVRGIAEEVW